MSQQPLLLTLTIQTGPQAGQTFIVQDGINVIGSDPNSADILLLDETISPNHARVVMQSEGTWIQDLDSTSGTFVNDQPVTTSIWLQPGNTIQIGPTVRLSVSSQPISSRGSAEGDTLLPTPSILSDETLVSQAPVAERQANLAPYNLVVQYGPQPGQLFQLVYGSQTIGRGADNQIVVQEPAISRQHAQITVQPEGVWIQDLGSSNGTFVNGQRLTGSVWLRPGDQIRLGTSVTVGLETSTPGFAPVVSQSYRRLIPGIVAVVVFLFLLGGAAYMGLRFFLIPEIVVASPLLGPTIRILAPTPDAKAAFNTPMRVHASVRDEQGVRHAQLWVNGKIVAAKNSISPEGDNPFTFVPVPPWAPLATGQQLLSVRAFSTDGRRNDSQAIDVNALRVFSERDSIPYIAQEGDTLQIIAEKVNREEEEIIKLNPQFKAIGAENQPPAEITIPAGVAIAVPADVAPEQLQPPDSPAFHDLPPPVTFDEDDSGTTFDSDDFDEFPPVAGSCSFFAPHEEKEWQLDIVDFASNNPPDEVSRDKTYCYITLSSGRQSIMIPPDPPTQNLTNAPFSFAWPEPVKPPQIRFVCQAENPLPGQPPLDLGSTDEITIDETGWPPGNPPEIMLHGEDGDLRMKYQISLAPNSEDGTEPSIPSPLVLARQIRQPLVTCPLLCPGQFCNQCGQVDIVTWRWPPGANIGDQPLCYEVYEEIRKDSELLIKSVVSPPVIAETITGAEITVLLPNQESKRLDCDTTADYYIQVSDTMGNDVPSERHHVSGPTCKRRATITFESLEVLKIPGTGWEQYKASFFANGEPLPPDNPWVGRPGLPQTGNTYFIADLLDDQNRLMDVSLSEQDDLIISATISKFIDGRWELPWCQPELKLDSQTVSKLIVASDTLLPLIDSEGACRVNVSVKVLEIEE